MVTVGVLVGVTLIAHAAVAAPNPPPQPPPAVAPPLPLGQHPIAPAPGSTGLGAIPAPLARSTPLSVAIPRTGLRADLIALGLNPDGTIAVPSGTQAKDAAWYDLGPTPGEPGPAVIVGHVDYLSLPQGRAAFFTLGVTRPGDQIDIDRADGTIATFTVDVVQRVAKTHFPTQAVYGPLAYPGLRLITCGGAFAKASGYTDNIIVFAHLSAVSTHDSR
jgi:sortase family protein